MLTQLPSHVPAAHRREHATKPASGGAHALHDHWHTQRAPASSTPASSRQRPSRQQLSSSQRRRAQQSRDTQQLVNAATASAAIWRISSTVWRHGGVSIRHAWRASAGRISRWRSCRRCEHVRCKWIRRRQCDAQCSVHGSFGGSIGALCRWHPGGKCTCLHTEAPCSYSKRIMTAVQPLLCNYVSIHAHTHTDICPACFGRVALWPQLGGLSSPFLTMPILQQQLPLQQQQPPQQPVLLVNPMVAAAYQAAYTAALAAAQNMQQQMQSGDGASTSSSGSQQPPLVPFVPPFAPAFALCYSAPYGQVGYCRPCMRFE